MPPEEVTPGLRPTRISVTCQKAEKPMRVGGLERERQGFPGTKPWSGGSGFACDPATKPHEGRHGEGRAHPGRFHPGGRNTQEGYAPRLGLNSLAQVADSFAVLDPEVEGVAALGLCRLPSLLASAAWSGRKFIGTSNDMRGAALETAYGCDRGRKP